jgi:hypothetical protein
MGSRAPCVSRWHLRPVFQRVVPLCFRVRLPPAPLLRAEVPQMAGQPAAGLPPAPLLWAEAPQMAGQQAAVGLPHLRVAPEAEPPL